MSRVVRNEPAARRQIQASIFAALGDPTRLSLVARLAGGEPCSISQLTRDTKLTRQAVTKHLRMLEHAQIVRSTRSGRESLFEFNPTPIDDTRRYLEQVSEQWDGALARLRAFVGG